MPARRNELVDPIPGEILQLRIVGKAHDEVIQRVVDPLDELRRAPGGGELRGRGRRQRQLHFDHVRAPLTGALGLLGAPQLLGAR